MPIEKILDEIVEDNLWIGYKLHCSCGRDFKHIGHYCGDVGEHILEAKCPACKSVSYIKCTTEYKDETWEYNPAVLSKRARVLGKGEHVTSWLGKLKTTVSIGCKCGSSFSVENKFRRREGAYIQDAKCPSCNATHSIQHVVHFEDELWTYNSQIADSEVTKPAESGLAKLANSEAANEKILKL